MTTKYEDRFVNEVVRLGQDGYTRTQMAAEFKVAYETLRTWANDTNKPEFQEAYKLALTCSQGYHEALMNKGIKGVLPKYCAPAHIFFMKNVFRDDYREQVDQKIDVTNQVKSMTDEELDETIKLLSAKRAKRDPKEDIDE